MREFMILGGNCIAMAVLRDLRVKGPVDNMYAIKGLYSCRSLFEGTFMDEFNEPEGFVNGEVHNQTILRNYIIMHNDYNSPRFKQELESRLETFNKYDGYYIYSLNEADCHGHMPSPLFSLGVDYLKSKGVLDRVLIVGQKELKGTLSTKEGWCSNWIDDRYVEGLSYINITDVNMVDSRQNQMELLKKIAEKNIFD